MFCTKCGTSLQETSAFCPQCGSPTGSRQQPKRLYRILSERKIAGVCAGMARYLDVDVALVRVIWLALLFLHGFGLIAYLIAWIVIPSDWKLHMHGQYA